MVLLLWYYQSWMIDPARFITAEYGSGIGNIWQSKQHPTTHLIFWLDDVRLIERTEHKKIIVYFGSFPTSSLSTDWKKI